MLVLPTKEKQKDLEHSTRLDNKQRERSLKMNIILIISISLGLAYTILCCDCFKAGILSNKIDPIVEFDLLVGLVLGQEWIGVIELLNHYYDLL